jgi:cation transport regulator ChaB
MGFADRSHSSPLLQWFADMLRTMSNEEIKVPTDFTTAAIETKKLLDSDVSGVVNTILDFAINSALTTFRIETNNSNLTKVLNNFLKNINSDLRGKVPVGIKALAKEYFRERWKGSSFLLLRTSFEEKEGFVFPTKLWFVNGEDIKVNEDRENESMILGKDQYSLKVSQNKTIKLPTSKEEHIFVQKPFSYWGEEYPTPFIVQRGIYKNLKLLELLEKKGEFVLAKALEYLFLMKKGSESLAQTGNPDFIYGEPDLKQIKSDFQTFLADRNTSGGVSTYVTNFDTTIEHLIPDYRKALDDALYAPIYRRLLAGLGMIEIVEGTASTRREALLNPKGFIAEVKAGIEDFISLLEDVLYVVKDKNIDNHSKYFSKNNEIKIIASPIKEFITDSLRTHVRSAYDRGVISKRFYAEITADCNFDIETKTRQDEFSDGLEELMYPPIIQNMESQTSEDEIDREENTTEDKKGIEKKNFNKSCICKKCNSEFVYDQIAEIGMGYVECPNCKEKLTDEDIDFGKVFESAPYKKILDLPSNVTNVLPKSLQKIFMRVFNTTYERNEEEDRARKTAWLVIKKIARKDKKTNMWIKKSVGSFNLDEVEEIIDE